MAWQKLCKMVGNRGYVWSKKLKTKAIFFLKKPKKLLNGETTIRPTHKQPEEQEVAQHDTAPVLHLLLWLV